MNYIVIIYLYIYNESLVIEQDRFDCLHIFVSYIVFNTLHTNTFIIDIK